MGNLELPEHVVFNKSSVPNFLLVIYRAISIKLADGILLDYIMHKDILYARFCWPILETLSDG